jgi:hypothetical protein
MRCRKMIDDAQPMAPEAIEPFWLQVRRIAEKLAQSGTEVEGKPGRAQDDAVNAVAGGIAVLVRLHSAWLAEVPEREEWCRTRIQEIVLEPPGGAEFDSPESVCTWTWDCFAAETLPVFWARSQGDQVLRQLVARLVFAPHYVAVEILFRRCAELRSSLRLDFARLRRLAFEYAYFRDRALFVQHSREASGRVAEEDVQKFGETVSRWVEEREDAFVRATSEPRWKRWADLDTDLFQAIDEARRAWNRDGHLDLHLIRAAHMWVPSLASALDAEERQEWLEFWREALAFVLRRASTSKHDHNYPYEDEQWVLARTAAMLLEMTASEDPKALFGAVLGLPAESHDWPEDFLQAFHRAALASEAVPAGYTSIFRAIFEQVLPADSAPTTKWPYHEEVWDALVGIDGFTQSYWAPRHAPLVASLSDVFETWWERAPAYIRRAEVFARWLERPAASPIRLRAIMWLERRLTADTGRAFDREDLGHAIASVLATTWQLDEARLRADAPAFAAFRRLLRVLADDQNELALDLLGRIGGLQ